jgi:hypothetical protein
MIGSRASRFLAISVALLSISACSYDCGVVSRTVANGTVRDAAGVALATVQVDLSDNLHPSFLRLSVGVMGSSGSAGAPLRSHVTRARLVTDAGELLAEIPTATTTLPSNDAMHVRPACRTLGCPGPSPPIRSVAT